MLEPPIKQIYDIIYQNAIRFLKRAIRELTAHHKESLDEDYALMSYLLSN